MEALQMLKVIDLELDLPPTVDDIVDRMGQFLLRSDEKGLANYGNIFGPSRARALEFAPDELERMRQLPEDELKRILRERAEKAVVSLSQFMEQLDEAGIEWGVVNGGSHEKTAELVAGNPERFIGCAYVDPHDGMKAVCLSLQVWSPCQRQEVLSLIRQSGRAGHPCLCLYDDDLPDRFPDGYRAPDISRRGSYGFPGDEDYRRSGRLAVDTGYGRGSPSPPEYLHQHCRPPAQVPSHARFGMGDADAVREYVAAGQDCLCLELGNLRHADRRSGQGDERIALEG
jgi:hypothetical protein